MAEDQETRTEAPSGKRLEDAANKGQVAYSQELTQSVLLLSGLGLVTACGGGVFIALQEVLRQNLAHAPRGDFDITTAGETIRGIIQRVSPTVIPMLAGLVLSAAFISYYQVGLRLRSEVLTFDLNRMNPVSGMSRLFSGRALVQLAISLGKLSIILGIVYASSGDLISQVVQLGRAPLRASYGTGTTLAFSLLLRVALATLLVGVSDLFYQRWKHTRDLMMTKEEVKEEHRQSEGDPTVKSKIRRQQRIMAQRRMLADVPKATVVVTNPTHFAVALRYRRPGGLEPADDAPVVLAKGSDLIAKRIREIATEANVPIVENPPLARALFRTTEVGMVIPGDLYKAVAEVLAFVFKLKGAARRSR